VILTNQEVVDVGFTRLNEIFDSLHDVFEVRQRVRTGTFSIDQHLDVLLLEPITL